MSDPFDRLVVFDFDGTCTLVEKEGKGFVSAVINTLSEVAGRGPETVRGLYEHHQREILKTPEAYDWIIDGVAVCPGTLDPYLRSSHVARKVLESFGISGDRLEGMMHVVGERYHDHYQKSDIALRPEFPDVLAAFCEEAHVAIVTNSAADAVEKKLRTIPNFDLSRVTLVGGAKKYVVGDELLSRVPITNIPKTTRIPGLARDVQLRRPHYIARLQEQFDRVGIRDPSKVTVIGDIFEMDGIVPLQLGCKFVLMVGVHTPPYEIRYMLADSRRCVATDLNEALGFFLAQ